MCNHALRVGRQRATARIGTWIGEGTAARQVSRDGTEILTGGGYQGIIDVKNLPKSTIIRTNKINF